MKTQMATHYCWAGVCGAGVTLATDAQKEHDLGRKHLLNHQYSTAITHFTRAIDSWTAPTGIEKVYFERGISREFLGQLDLAIQDFSNALEIKPAAHLLLRRGTLNEKQNRYSAAVRDYMLACNLSPSDPQVLLAAAWLLATSPIDADRNGNDAITLAQMAIDQIGPDNNLALRVLAAAHAENGNYSKALEMERQARNQFLKNKPVEDGPEAIEFTLTLVEFECRIELYGSHTPYRIDAPKLPDPSP